MARIDGNDGDNYLAAIIYGLSNDEIYGNGGKDTLRGWQGDDFLSGGDGDDRLEGEDGNDILSGGNGNDTLLGGSGYDTALYFGLFSNYGISFTVNGDVRIAAGEGIDLLNGIERVNFANDAFIDVLTGDGSDNSLTANPNVWSMLYGGNGNDILTGSQLIDTLVGGNGNDKLYGGNGYDISTYFGQFSSYGISFTANGDVQVTGGEGTDLLNGIERVYFANDAFVDVLTGDGGNNVLTANPNVWSMLYGGDGNDILTGSQLRDTIVGGSGYDTALYSGQFSSYGVSFTANGNIQIVNNQGIDLLNGIERVYFANDAFVDVLTGDGGNNVLTANPNVWSMLYGGNGNDILTGSQLIDTLVGGNGNDKLYGGNGYDISTYFGQFSSYGISFTANGDVQVTGGEGTDLLNGIERVYFANDAFVDVLTGDGGNNVLTANPNVWSMLYGGNGNDILTGSQLIDTLVGGAGNDQLTGGSGNDQFKFGGSNSSLFGTTKADTITDFVMTADKIALGRKSFSALQSPIGGTLLASEFAIVTNDSQAGSSSAKIVYNSVNGNLFYNQNGSSSGYGTGGLFAKLNGSPDNLSTNDFLILSA